MERKGVESESNAFFCLCFCLFCFCFFFALVGVVVVVVADSECSNLSILDSRDAWQTLMSLSKLSLCAGARDSGEMHAGLQGGPLPHVAHAPALILVACVFFSH